MELNWTEVILGVLGLLGTISAGILGIYKAHVDKKRITQMEAEMDLHKTGLDFTTCLAEIHTIEQHVNSLANTSEIDSVVIITAVNGILDPRWISEVWRWEYDKNMEHGTTIRHTEIDSDMVDRLQMVMRRGSTMESMTELDPGVYKDMYLMDGIKAGYLAHINTKRLGPQCVKMSFCMFRSHNNDRIDQATLAKCWNIVGMFKQADGLFG